ncbi:MAG: hypothetical protein E7231_09740 [Cellulosilyticum sp.]|nr:hypothetical protein [Cellulosilyticum sp.]
MPNIVQIDWTMDEMKISLINVDMPMTSAHKNKILDEMENKSLGMNMFNLEMVQYVLPYLMEVDDLESLFFEIEKYYIEKNSQKNRGLEELLNPNYARNLQDKVVFSNSGKQYVMKYERIVREVIQMTGLERRVERFFRRFITNITQYPIDLIVINENVDQNRWLKNYIQTLFKNQTVCIGMNDELLDRLHKEQILPCTEQLILCHKGQEITLLTQEDFIKDEISVSKEFTLKFALDAAIEITIIRRWRQDGVSEQREVANEHFYHPIFYTGDRMRIEVSKNKDTYDFKLIHLDTGMEMNF